jgi:uncharacterized protein (DUF1330 family)
MAEEHDMAKGYWIAHMSINHPEETAKTAFQKYGAKFLVRGGRYEAAEGDGRPRNVIIEFESFEQALACYRSPEYQEAVKIRQRAAEGEIMIVEGVD